LLHETDWRPPKIVVASRYKKSVVIKMLEHLLVPFRYASRSDLMRGKNIFWKAEFAPF
jgi:hypothetical protein